MRLADGVLLVVDAAEGALVVTEKVVKQALAEGLPITLLLTKARPPRRPAAPARDVDWLLANPDHTYTISQQKKPTRLSDYRRRLVAVVQPCPML